MYVLRLLRRRRRLLLLLLLLSRGCRGCHAPPLTERPVPVPACLRAQTKGASRPKPAYARNDLGGFYTS